MKIHAQDRNYFFLNYLQFDPIQKVIFFNIAFIFIKTQGVNHCLDDTKFLFTYIHFYVSPNVPITDTMVKSFKKVITKPIQLADDSLNVAIKKALIEKSIDIKQSKSLKFADFFLDEQMADVNFIFKDALSTQKIPALKLILAAGSPVFKTMFFGSLPVKGDIRIIDVTSDGFKAFLQYFYLDELNLTMENVNEVMYLAKKYDINECLIACHQYLKYSALR